MNLLYGEIVEIFREDDALVGQVRVGGALKKIPLGLLTDPQPGDNVLLCEGVALARVESSSRESHYVPRHTR
jgi:hydrogenase maturation factor